MDNKTTFFKLGKRQSNFVTIDCTALRDERLSWKAKGLHSYLMQLPGDWDLNMVDLIGRAKDGRDGLMSGVKELIEYGYFTRTTVRDQGKIKGVMYEVFEVPTVNGFSVYGESVNGFPVNGKSTTTKDEALTKDEESKDEWSPPSISEVEEYFRAALKDKPGVVGEEYWAEWEAVKFIEYWSGKKWKVKRKYIDAKKRVGGWVRSGMERGTYTRVCPKSPDYGKKPWEVEEKSGAYEYDLDEIMGKSEPNPLADKFRM